MTDDPKLTEAQREALYQWWSKPGTSCGYPGLLAAVARMVATAEQAARAEARAQAVACQTAADDLRAQIRGLADAWELAEAEPEAIRARVEAVIAPWPHGVRKGDVIRALDGSGS